MRYVDRKSVRPPASLSDPHGAGRTEYLKAKAHYAGPDGGSYEFKAYKGQDVVEKLRELFKRKCAYCESNFEAVTPMDVEHYRPKGGVKGDAAHGGYWWLAACWDNLLSACPDCNRERYQHVATEGMTQRDMDAIARILSGKKDAFPIAGTRARKEGDDHEIEDPLLIDPTRRDPSQHLSWEELNYAEHANTLSIVTPRRNAKKVDPYGDESIAIYGLNRRGLVERRTSLLLGLKIRATKIERLAILTAGLSKADRPPFLEMLESEFKDFLSFADDDREYSQCAQAYIQNASVAIVKHLKELKASHESIKVAG